MHNLYSLTLSPPGACLRASGKPYFKSGLEGCLEAAVDQVLAAEDATVTAAASAENDMAEVEAKELNRRTELNKLEAYLYEAKNLISNRNSNFDCHL